MIRFFQHLINILAIVLRNAKDCNGLWLPYPRNLYLLTNLVSRRFAMLKKFENWLLNNNYRPTTAFDYQGRIERLCRKEGYTLSHLDENIALILPEYEINGKKSSYGKRSHTSVRQALRRFKMFLISNKLVESVK